jgi:predicted DsbA family dithiol-disulfide isomerase
VRLRRLQVELGPGLTIESRAFMLRPEPDPSVHFKGTYREEGWRRCGLMSAPDGLTFTPWPHDVFPAWSVPALEAAKCAAKQGDDVFGRVHLRLYEAFFTESRNIADRTEIARIVAECGVDRERFAADYATGIGREAVVADHTAALAGEGVQAIPTVIIAETGRRLVGLADLATYRSAVLEAAG